MSSIQSKLLWRKELLLQRKSNSGYSPLKINSHFLLSLVSFLMCNYVLWKNQIQGSSGKGGVCLLPEIKLSLSQ